MYRDELPVQSRLDGRRSLGQIPEAERQGLALNFVKKEFFESRLRFRYWASITGQSAQFDDGYLSQHAVSLITGQVGVNSHGKGKDLASGDEIKSGRRIDQKDSKEDSHILFKFGNSKELGTFLTCRNCFISFFDLDDLGRPRYEVWRIHPSESSVTTVFRTYWSEQLNGNKSNWSSHQLNLRIYPDRSRSQFHKVFLALDPRLIFLARDFAGNGDATLEVFDVAEGHPPAIGTILGKRGTPLTGSSIAGQIPGMIKDRALLASELFSELVVARVERLAHWSELTNQPINTGLDTIAQHLVSLVTGIRGTGSNARGSDLQDGSEVKSVVHMGKDRPRWDCGHDWERILNWTEVYLVQSDRNQEGRLRARITKPDREEFRDLVRRYEARYPDSKNFQLHPRFGRAGVTRHENVAQNSCGELTLNLLAQIEEGEGGAVSFAAPGFNAKFFAREGLDAPKRPD